MARERRNVEKNSHTSGPDTSSPLADDVQAGALHTLLSTYSSSSSVEEAGEPFKGPPPPMVWTSPWKVTVFRAPLPFLLLLLLLTGTDGSAACCVL